MKELKDISWNVTEEEYRADPAISYSTLSRFKREGFDGLDKLFEKIETPSLTFGSIVDALITGGMEEYEQRFIVIPDYGISDSLRIIVKNLYDVYKDYYSTLNDIPDTIVSDVAINCGYYTDAKYYNVRVKKVKECGPYYDILKSAEGKIPISRQQYEDAMECVRILKTSPSTKYIFGDDTDAIKHYYQLKFKGDYNGIPLRCMADVIVVDTVNKIVYPYDLKTSGHPEWEFPKSFIHWNYMIQSQLYWYLIRKAMDNDAEFKDYELADYQFVVICNLTKTPLVWKFEGTQDEECIYGNEKQYKMPQWRQIATELYGYLQEHPRVPNGIKLEESNNITEWLNRQI